jgi:hypothetical protein
VKLLKVQFQEVTERFTVALRRALPDLPEPEIVLRLHCAIGAVGHVLASAQHAELAREFGLPQDGEDAALRRLVVFCAAGFRAPAAGAVAAPAADAAAASAVEVSASPVEVSS